MLNLNIAICDDSEDDLIKFNTILENYEIAKDVNFHIDTFQSAKELFSVYKKSNDYHLVFLDIEMPSVNGIRAAEIIRTTIDRHVTIIFISNYPQYMQDSFKVHPFHYITKPVSTDAVYSVMDEIIHDIQESNLFYTLLSSNDKEVTVNIKDIIYIDVTDGKKGILCFHTERNHLYSKGTISTWYEKLKDYNFFQCFRGILINLLHVHYFEKHTVVLDNGTTIPVNRSSEKELHDAYFNKIVRLRNL